MNALWVKEIGLISIGFCDLLGNDKSCLQADRPNPSESHGGTILAQIIFWRVWRLLWQ